MALVQSRLHKVYKTKWSHSCQPRWLPVSHETLVQEGNYLSHTRHIWQRDTPKIPAHVTRTDTFAQWDHPQIGFWRNSPLAIRGPKTLLERPKRKEYTILKSVTEEDFRSLLRQLSSTHQGASPHHADLTALLPEPLPCWSPLPTQLRKFCLVRH